MRVAIVGGHGAIARHLGRALARRGDEVLSLHRAPEQSRRLLADGVHPALLDLESAGVGALADLLAGVDAAVFAAGAGPGSGSGRKDTVDRAGAVLLADAAEKASVPYLLQVSSMGVESVRAGRVLAGVPTVFLAYLRAKLAAEDDLRGRDGLAWTILRPGRLTDDAASGHVRLAPQVPRGPVSRADVAGVLLAILDHPLPGAVLELTEGPTQIAAAVEAVDA